MLDRPPRAGAEDSVNGRGQVNPSQKMIEAYQDRRRHEHTPIPVKRENDQRTKDMKMGLDAAAGQGNQQRRHEHLGDRNNVAGGSSSRPGSRHPDWEKTDGAPDEYCRPNVDMNLTRAAFPGPW